VDGTRAVGWLLDGLKVFALNVGVLETLLLFVDLLNWREFDEAPFFELLMRKP